MPVRLKVRYLTRMEKPCIGSSGNGTKASTVGAPPRPLVSGEQIPCQKAMSNIMASHSLP